MAISVGTSTVTGGNLTTGFTLVINSGVAANDILVLGVTNRDATADPSVTDNDTGGNAWAKLGGQNAATNGAITVWWKRATSGTASKTITVSGCTGSASGCVTPYTGALQTGTPFGSPVSEANASADESQAGITTAYLTSWVLFFVGCTSNDTLNPASYTASDPSTLTERAEGVSSGGSDCSMSHASAERATAGATGTIAWSQTNGTGASLAVELYAQAQGVTPGSALATTQTPALTVTLGTLNAEPTTASAVSTAADPSITLGALSVTPSSSSATSSATDPDVANVLTVTPTTATAAATAADPDVTNEGGAQDITPTTATAVSTAADPSIALGALDVTPTTASAVSTAADPSVTPGTLDVTPTAAATASTAASPDVTLGAVGVETTAATSTATAAGPDVALGAVSSTPTSATATATAADPAITLGALSVEPTAAPAVALAADASAGSNQDITPTSASAAAAGTSPSVANGVTAELLAAAAVALAEISASNYVKSAGSLPSASRAARERRLFRLGTRGR